MDSRLSILISYKQNHNDIKWYSKMTIYQNNFFYTIHVFNI